MSENPGKRSSCGNGATLSPADRFRGSAGFISECMSIEESARDRLELFGKVWGAIVLQFGHSEAVAVADTLFSFRGSLGSRRCSSHRGWSGPFGCHLYDMAIGAHLWRSATTSSPRSPEEWQSTSPNCYRTKLRRPPEWSRMLLSTCR